MKEGGRGTCRVNWRPNGLPCIGMRQKRALAALPRSKQELGAMGENKEGGIDSRGFKNHLNDQLVKLHSPTGGRTKKLDSAQLKAADHRNHGYYIPRKEIAETEESN